MQAQIKELQGKLEKAEEELNAWSFTADSVTGKVRTIVHVKHTGKVWKLCTVYINSQKIQVILNVSLSILTNLLSNSSAI